MPEIISSASYLSVGIKTALERWIVKSVLDVIFL